MDVFHFHLYRKDESVRLVDFVFAEGLLKYLVSFRESKDSNKEFRIFVEDANFTLEKTLWQFVFDSLVEHEKVYDWSDDHDGSTIPLHLEESMHIKAIQLNDLYRMARVFNFYNIPLMLDLVLKTVVRRLLLMTRKELLLSNPGTELKEVSQIYREMNQPLQRLNKAYNVRLLDMSAIFRQNMKEDDLVNLVSSLYVAQTSNVLAFNMYGITMITQKGLFTCANFSQLKSYDNQDRWRAVSSSTDAKNAISVWSGGGHTLILTPGGLMGIGSNKYNQLGFYSKQGSGDIALDFERLDLEGVLSAACGHDHSLARTRNGVYAFGKNTQGQLGLGFAMSSTTAARIDFEKGIEIKVVACGDDYSLFLTTDGKVYGCGLNQSGVLGQDPAITEKLFSPEIIPMPESDIRIVSMSAGATHALFVDDHGRVFNCGANGNLQLGNGTNVDSFVVKEVHPSYSPIVTVVATKKMSFFIDEVGDLFASGADDSGHLGITGVSLFARKVERLSHQEVISVVSYNDRFTCALTCDGLYLLQPLDNNGLLPPLFKMSIDVTEDHLVCKETALSSAMYSK